jgi:low affinity Fe/Cu permease
VRDEVQVRFDRLWQAVADTVGAPRFLVAVVVFVGLVVAAVGSLGAPLITAVAGHYRVSLAAAQWTLTIALLSGAIATPLLGRFGSGPRRRPWYWPPWLSPLPGAS